MPFEQFADFLWLAWFPVVVTAICELIFGGIARLTGIRAIFLLYALPSIVVALSFQVGWNRVAVLGGDGISGRPYFTFGSRETGFLAAGVIIGVVCFGPASALTGVIYAARHSADSALLALGALAAIALFLLGGIGYIRAKFIYPAIAVDRFSSVREILGLTKGLGWEIFLIVLGTLVPFQIPLWTILFLSRGDGVAHMLVRGTFSLLLGFLAAGASAAAIGLAYREKAGLIAAEAPLGANQV